MSGYTGSYAPRGTAYLARVIDGADVNTRPQILEALLAFGVRTLVLDRKLLTDRQIEAWQAVAREVRPSTTPLDAGRFVVLHLGPRVFQQRVAGPRSRPNSCCAQGWLTWTS